MVKIVTYGYWTNVYVTYSIVEASKISSSAQSTTCKSQGYDFHTASAPVYSPNNNSC